MYSINSKVIVIIILLLIAFYINGDEKINTLGSIINSVVGGCISIVIFSLLD